jgi:hypothetical protein
MVSDHFKDPVGDDLAEDGKTLIGGWRGSPGVPGTRPPPSISLA